MTVSIYYVIMPKCIACLVILLSSYVILSSVHTHTHTHKRAHTRTITHSHSHTHHTHTKEYNLKTE